MTSVEPAACRLFNYVKVRQNKSADALSNYADCTDAFLIPGSYVT